MCFGLFWPFFYIRYVLQMGLLKTPESEEKLLLASNEALKDTSPFKDLMATMEKPADLTAHPGTASAASAFHQYHNIISPPKSADCVSKKTTFFQVNRKATVCRNKFGIGSK